MIFTLEGPEKLLPDPKYYTKNITGINPNLTIYLVIVLKVGQIQLIRRQITRDEMQDVQFDSNNTTGNSRSLNQSLLTAIEAHYKDPSIPYPGEDNAILFELTPYLESAGFHDPLSKIYVTQQPVVKNFSIICFLFVITQLPKLVYNKSVGSLLSRKPTDPLDGPAFVTGCLSLLRQFHSHNTDQFLGYMGQYVRSMVHSNASTK
ncbi:WASH complex subunit 5 [Geodia barretti]|nr:WASH complex subunit 5 [Geodia barretti]